MNLVAAGVMELIGIRRPRGRDLATGIVLGAALGLAALFLYWDTTSPAPPGPPSTCCSGRSSPCRPSMVPVIAVLERRGHRHRPDALPAAAAELAQPRPGRRPRGAASAWSASAILVALALAVSLSAVTIGAILSTALLIGPAATALRLTRRTGSAMRGRRRHRGAAPPGWASSWPTTATTGRRRNGLAGQLLRGDRSSLVLRRRISSCAGASTEADRGHRSQPSQPSQPGRRPDVLGLHGQRLGGGHHRGRGGRRGRVLHRAARLGLRRPRPAQRSFRRRRRRPA